MSYEDAPSVPLAVRKDFLVDFCEVAVTSKEKATLKAGAIDRVAAEVKSDETKDHKIREAREKNEP